MQDRDMIDRADLLRFMTRILCALKENGANNQWIDGYEAALDHVKIAASVKVPK